MVLSCKNYLTDNHTIDIRTLDSKELLKRIDHINNLYHKYREIFLKIKQQIENHYSNQTHEYLSERHILGQYDFLSRRLTKVFIFLSNEKIDYLLINIFLISFMK